LKILILKPSSLGDVIHALPVLRLLKQHYRQSEIFWWIDSSLAPLIEGDPDLAGIVRFERKRWGKPRHWPEMLGSIRWMRAQHFDLVIDLQCLLRSAAFAWLANGKQLVGLDEIREGARGFYDSAAPRKDFHTHAVDWYLSVLPPLGVPVHKNFVWLPERTEVAAEIKRKWPVANASLLPSSTRYPHLIALQPGARWKNKRWPVQNFAKVVHRLAHKFPEVHFAVLGGEDDLPLGETIAQAVPEKVLNLCGKTSLTEMIEWVRRCDLLLTNDTGPMHVAAAMNKPLVALFGPTEPRRTGPYGQLENVLRLDLPCSPCLSSHCSIEETDKCLRDLSPATVIEKVEKLLA
jgi:lipopolysaccharide heptosyltransferase II